jgi:hypothetical protein
MAADRPRQIRSAREPDQATKRLIYLSKVAAEEVETHEAGVRMVQKGQPETVLLMEDADMIWEAMAEILRRLRYIVIAVCSGAAWLMCLIAMGCTPSAIASPQPEGVSVTPVSFTTSPSTLISSPPAPAVMATLTPTISLAAVQEKRVITVEAEGLELNYSQALHWDEKRFDREYYAYSTDKPKYLRDFSEAFSKEFLNPVNLEATDWKVSFTSEYELETDKAKYIALFQCKIHGAASGTAESPTFRTEWLLRPIFGNRLDLYNFECPTESMIVYAGKIDRIPITLTLRFPEPIHHCHYHIWYER